MPSRPDPSDVPDPAAAADPHDPLLVQAREIGELPLDQRPSAFEALNRTLACELQALEEA